MGARLPTRGSPDPDVIEFGIAALAPELETADVEFPASAEELVRTLGDPAIPVDSRGNEISLSRAVGELDRRRFGSEREFLDALHPVFEAHREAVASGFLATIRALLPG